MRHAREVYDLLGVLLTDEDIVGESFYNPLLPVVVAELDEKGLLVEDDGALCVFPEGFENRQGEPLPLIVRKSDGGYGYPATDLAAVRDRTGRLGATRLRLRRGGRAVAAPAPGLRRRPRWPATCPTATRPIHVAFGLVLGTDGKKLASRGGELRAPHRPADRGGRPGRGRHEGARRATCRPSARPPWPTRSASAPSSTPTCPPSAMRDYVFDWDRMLAFEGDTGPVPAVRARPHPLHLPARRRGPAGTGRGAAARRAPERALALQLLRFGEAVEATAETCSPSKLCTYLFELATSFTDVLRGLPGAGRRRGGARPRGSALCDLTARVLELGLSLLGMEAPEQM